MQRALILIFILAYMADGSFCQNLTDKEGLKTGFWVNQYELAYGKFKETGVYKVVSLNNFDIVSQTETLYSIRFKGGIELLHFEGRKEDQLSVKDGMWTTVDADGLLYKVDFWDQGINIWTKYYDKTGSLKQYDYYSPTDSTRLYLTYKDTALFKKVYYPPSSKNTPTEIYYPARNLVIPNAELLYIGIFRDSIKKSHTWDIYCKAPTQIISIKSASANLKVESATTLPVRLLPNEKISIKVLFEPTTLTYNRYDTITIQTTESNTPYYKVYYSIYFSHIDGSNVETLKSLKLSKSKDRYLYIAPMGTTTFAYIKNRRGKEQAYKIRGTTKIDLKKLKTGIYDLKVLSCHTGGEMKLIIVE